MIKIDYHGNELLQFMDFLACGCHVSDTRRKNLFDASIKTDIVIDVKNCIRMRQKTISNILLSIKYLMQTEVYFVMV